MNGKGKERLMNGGLIFNYKFKNKSQFIMLQEGKVTKNTEIQSSKVLRLPVVSKERREIVEYGLLSLLRCV